MDGCVGDGDDGCEDYYYYCALSRDMGLNIIIPQCLYYENNDDGLSHDIDDGDNVDSDVHEDDADANLQVPRALSQDGNEHGE